MTDINTVPSGRIIVIDDELEIREYIKLLLEGAHYEVFTASSGEEALAILKKQDFDVMVTDIRMPGMEGIELIKKAGLLQPTMESMMMTGYGDIDTAINAIKLGAVNYFTKPIKMDELLIALERCLGKIRLQNKLIESEKRLEEANKNLEAEVEQRTSELIKTVSELRLLAEVFEKSSDSIIITDTDATILRVNPGFYKSAGYTPDEVIGRNPRILKSGHHDQEFYKNLWDSLIKNGEWEGEIWNRKKSGEITPESLCIKAIQDEGGKNQYYVAIARDLSEIKKRENKMSHLAYHDYLTGLANRNLLLDRLKMAIAHAERYGRCVAVIFVDLNKFKPINDQYGHNTGDKVLQIIAERLQIYIRAEDTCSRIGGDEFVIVLASVQQREEIKPLVMRIMQEIEQPISIKQRDHLITASIGIAFYPDDGTIPEKLIEAADKEMYRHKNNNGIS
jgi:diguanylate cyclase (GGDEF)-like protein/PAS domain S-box-containing protein